MTPEEIIARAAPPPERADARRFEPIATDPGSLARRHAGLREAFGSDAALAAHAASLGLTADAWRGRFGDVRLAGPPPDWAETFLAVHERLRAAPPRPGAALGEWMRAELEAGWPAGLPRAPGALDGPLEHLRKRMDNAAFGCLHAERKLGLERAWPERFRRHPALAYVFGRALRDGRDDLLRIAGRAAADRALLARALFGGADPGELRGLTPGLGDPHAGGRSVAFLDFARGRVVYKPKDLRIAGLVGELARALDVPGVETTDIVLRGGYAWERAYEARPLGAPGEAAGFYHALGAWQALLQALGGNDFWFDNLLADGAVPRFLDYETAVQPEASWPGGVVDRLPAGAAARLRLLPGATGVMPYPWAVGDGVDPTDLGCLARPGRHRSPLPDVERGGAFSWEAGAFAPRDGRRRAARRRRPLRGVRGRPRPGGGAPLRAGVPAPGGGAPAPLRGRAGAHHPHRHLELLPLHQPLVRAAAPRRRRVARDRPARRPAPLAGPARRGARGGGARPAPAGRAAVPGASGRARPAGDGG